MPEVDPRLPERQDESESSYFAAYRNSAAAAAAAEKDGDHEAAAILHAQARKDMKEAYDALDAATGARDPTSGMSTPQKYRAVLGQRLANIKRNLPTAIGGATPDEAHQADLQDAPLLRTPEAAGAALLGDTAFSALPVGVTEAAIARLGPLAKRLTQVPAIERGAQRVSDMLVGSPVRRGFTQGASQNYLTGNPNDSAGSRLIEGGAAGMLLPGAGAALKRYSMGATRSPAGQLLVDRGVDITPGQMNPHGIANFAEQMPVGRSILNNSRNAAKLDWNRALAEEATVPGTKIDRALPDKMLDAAYQPISHMYDSVRGYGASATIRRAQGPDRLLSDAFDSAAKAPGAVPNVQKSARKWLKDNLNAKVQLAVKNGGMSVGDLQDLRSDIRNQIRSYAGGTDAMSKQYAAVFSRAEDAITQAIESHLPAKAASVLRDADMHYVKYKVLEDALNRSTSRAVGATPHEVLSALKAATPSKGQFVRRKNAGSALEGLRKLADAGAEVFAENPELRTGHSVGILGAVPRYAAGIGAGLMGATRAGRRIASGAMPHQKALADLMARLSDPGSEAKQLVSGPAKAFLPRAAVPYALNLSGIPEFVPAEPPGDEDQGLEQDVDPGSP